MSPATTSRSIVEDVLGRVMTREIWTGNYEKVLPISIQDYDISAILPAVFYMFRFGQRRGKGKFREVFGADIGTPAERRSSATIDRVAGHMADNPALEGFGGKIEQAILGDLLLCFSLENANRALGRGEQIQRVAPAHYMSSWVDLPDKVVHLRYVPEMIVAMLANQEGSYVQQSKEGERTRFTVGRGFEDNILLSAFHQGVVHRGELGSRTSDRFEEETPVGIDQLLMIRLAQAMGSAPDKLRGAEGERISNQRPIAEKAGRFLSEDIRRFVREYAHVIPRQSLVVMLESCIAVGLTTVLTSVIELLFDWAETGEIPKPTDQKSAYFFVDCSNGVDRRLRALAEISFDDFMRRVERFPVILMALRLLDWGARYNPAIKKERISSEPYATEWLNTLGNILYGRHPEAPAILYHLQENATVLAERLREENPEAAEILENTIANPNPVWRLADALTLLLGRANAQENMLKCLDSALLMGRPNGLASKRRVREVEVSFGRKTRMVRSFVFTDSAQDYLVHLHVLSSGNRDGPRNLSFKDFMDILRERYGFCVDEPPPGMTISNDLLRANRAILEQRLRDLGLLSGVNDAEAMKRLKPRFTPVGEGSE